MDFLNLNGKNKEEKGTELNNMLNIPGLSNVPQIQTGDSYGTEDGEEFTDMTECLEAKDGKGTIQARKVKGIYLRCAYIVDGIKLLYEDHETVFRGNSRGGGEHWIMLEEGDEIVGVSGHYDIPYGGGGAISQLCIRTKKEKIYGPFGYGQGEKTFHADLPADASFAGFHGKVKSNAYLAKLGLLYYEKK